MNIQIYGTHNTKDTFGDFNWMCNQDEYTYSLFIFNDNEGVLLVT